MSVPAPVPRPRANRGLGWLTLLGAVLVIAFYLWTARSPNVPYEFHEHEEDYYNLLTHGFQAGHLYLPVTPDPRLAGSDPAVRAQASYLLDASLYQGHYYLYFGVAPVLVAFLPWTLLFGYDLPVNFAAVLFASVGFLAAVALLWRLRRRHDLKGGAGLWFTLVLALGLCTVAPAALRRANFYEVAVCSGYAFGMLFLVCLHEAEGAPRHRALWLGGASLSYGLAVGSRPNLVLAGALLPAAVLLVWWPGRRQAGAARDLTRLTLAAGLPAAMCLGGLFAYNYLRFGNGFEFGNHYQIAIRSDRADFSPSYLWHNLRLYYLTWPSVSRYFPFFAPGAEPPQPPGYFGREFLHGQFYFLPLALLAALGALAARRRPGIGALLPITGGLLFCFLVNGFIVCLGGMRANRYQLDFQPALLVAVCLGLLLLAEGRGWRWRGPAGLSLGLVLLGCFYNAMISLQTDGAFQANNPRSYARLARWFDYPSWWYQRLTHAPMGPLELQVAFPSAPRAALEPLVATGTPWFSDILFVHYEDAHTIRFLLEHAGHGGPASPPVPVVPGRDCRLEVELGSLYPPAEHPCFAELSRAQMRLLKRTVRVSLNGITVFHASADFYDASPGQVFIGESRLWPAMAAGRFSGRILATRTRPLPLAPWPDPGGGPIVLRVRLPEGQTGAAEPLLLTGKPGRADVVFVEYVDAGHVRFGLDHWLHAASYSAVVAVDYAATHDIAVWLGSLAPAGSSLAERERFAVDLDGRRVLSMQTPFYDAPAFTLDVGHNSVGASSCRLDFSGDILELRRGNATAR